MNQKELSESANHLRVAAMALKQAPKAMGSLVDYWHNRSTTEVTVDPAPAACPSKLPAYTPLRKAPDKTLPKVFGVKADGVFCGVSINHNASPPTVHVINYGEVPCRIKGPVNPNDPLSLPDDSTADYLIKSDGTSGVGTPAIALGSITDSSIKVIWIRIGAGGGATTPTSGGNMNFAGEFDEAHTVQVGIVTFMYKKGDVVIVRLGVSAGLFIAARDIPVGSGQPIDPPQDPTQGVNWIQLASGWSAGAWV